MAVNANMPIPSAKSTTFDEKGVSARAGIIVLNCDNLAYALSAYEMMVSGNVDREFRIDGQSRSQLRGESNPFGSSSVDYLRISLNEAASVGGEELLNAAFLFETDMEGFACACEDLAYIAKFYGYTARPREVANSNADSWVSIGELAMGAVIYNSDLEAK